MRLRHWIAAGLLGLGIVACDGGTEPDPELRITPSPAEVGEGETLLLQAQGATSQVTWASDDPDVARISGTGVVTGVRVGSTVVRATAGRQQAQTPVTVTLPPLLGFSAPALHFTVEQGSAAPGPQTVRIENQGLQPLTGLTAGAPVYGGSTSGWITRAELSGTTAPTVLNVAVDPAGLAPGTYQASVPVSGSAVNSPQSLIVVLDVVDNPVLAATPARVDLFAPANQIPAPVSVDITTSTPGNVGDLTLGVSYSGSEQIWMDVSLVGTRTPATLELEVTRALPQGTHRASITVASRFPGARAVTIPVALEVGPGPSIGLSASAVSMSAVVGTPTIATRTVSVTNAGAQTLDGLTAAIDYGTGPSGWLQAVMGGTAPTTLALAATPGTLAVGTYTATVQVSSPVANNSPRSVAVTFAVTPVNPPVVQLSTSAVSFAAPAGGSPSAQAVSITNGGGGTLDGLSAQVGYQNGSGWLSASLSGTAAPAVLTLNASTGGLSVGVWRATVTVASTSPGAQARTVSVTLTVVPSFATDIYPRLNAQCTGCHYNGGTPPNFGAGASTARTQLLTLSSFGAAWVVSGDPNAGRLVCRIKGTCTSGSSTDMTMSALDVERIQQWIAGGTPP